jgi:putative transposase
MRPAWARAIVNLYAEARAPGDILLHAYVVMPDHYHVLLTLVGCPSISNLVRRIHAIFSYRVRRAGASAPARQTVGNRVWQKRFYDHVIRDERDFLAKFGYIHDNPVLSELVLDPKDYPWSSFHFWEMGDETVPCDGG